MGDERRPDRTRWIHVPLLAFGALVLLAPVQVVAQGAGCVLQPAGFPSRQVIRCGTGLSVEATAGADYTLVDHNKDTVPDAVDLRAGAVFVHAPARAGGRGFRVQTPQAIAAVRGTDWAVDAGSGKTSVFVVAGRVAVQRARGGRGVTLGPGDGVDVEAGTAPLQVKRWSAERAAALLARFGR
jgi:ferric-dicitrate binding protein FerR (iron transport regulator)